MKIQFKGRLGSSLRKRTSIIKLGSMPLQTIESDIKFSFVKAITIYGICSIKIWYHY
jgi:small subunit ribosomal protein S3